MFGVETVESSHNLISKMRPQIADDVVDEPREEEERGSSEWLRGDKGAGNVRLAFNFNASSVSVSVP